MQLAFEFECIRTRNTHVAQQKQGYHHESAASYPGPCMERVLRMGLGMSLVCEQPILLYGSTEPRVVKDYVITITH